MSAGTSGNFIVTGHKGEIKDSGHCGRVQRGDEVVCLIDTNRSGSSLIDIDGPKKPKGPWSAEIISDCEAISLVFLELCGL